MAGGVDTGPREGTVMDVNEVRGYLPHRYPFLLVDRVVELNLGQSIVAVKNVSINEPFFDGHFPEQPVFPGVLLVEAMAQASGILGFKTMNKKPADGSIYYFVGADKLRFLSPVPAGARVHSHSRLVEVEGTPKGTRVVTEIAVHVVGSDRPALVYDGITLYQAPRGSA